MSSYWPLSRASSIRGDDLTWSWCSQMSSTVLPQIFAQVLGGHCAPTWLRSTISTTIDCLRKTWCGQHVKTLHRSSWGCVYSCPHTQAWWRRHDGKTGTALEWRAERGAWSAWLHDWGVWRTLEDVRRHGVVAAQQNFHTLSTTGNNELNSIDLLDELQQN